MSHDTDSDIQPPHPKISVIIDGDRSKVFLDGVGHPVHIEDAMFFHELIKAGPHGTTGPKLRQISPLYFDRPDRLSKKLKKKSPRLGRYIQTTWEANGWKYRGYRLDPELLG